jgi:hypothetical protein
MADGVFTVTAFGLSLAMTPTRPGRVPRDMLELNSQFIRSRRVKIFVHGQFRIRSEKT